MKFYLAGKHDDKFQFFVQCLNKMEPKSLSTSSKRQEVIDHVFGESPDIIILSTDLDDGSGLEVIEILKGAQSSHEIPVIIYGNDQTTTNDIVRGLEMGATDFIVFPVHEAEFMARVKVAIRNFNIQKALREKAVTDTLTGLHNRSILEYRLQTELKRSQRHSIPISMVMIDIDHFKLVNDNYGHLFGDQVLKALGEILLKRARTDDIVVRFGGEEFLLLLFGADIQGAYAFAERVRLDFLSKIFYVNKKTVNFTLSAGVAQYSGNIGPSVFMDMADQALYHAKHSGRNLVKVYDDVPKDAQH